MLKPGFLEDSQQGQLVDPADMMELLTVDSAFLEALLMEDEDAEPPENLTENSSPPPLLHTDSVQPPLHKRVETRVLSPTANQCARRRIWGVSSTCYTRNHKLAVEKMPSMDAKRDSHKVSYLSHTLSGSATTTSEVGYTCNQLAANLQFSGHGVAEDSEMKTAARSERKRKDASRNLLAERQRRRQLNERLFSLRALVPNISKMDKASVVADAISYVKELQCQVEATQEEVSHLAATLKALANGRASQCTPSEQHRHQVVKFTMIHIEDKVYQLQLHCERSLGMLLQLAKAIEALKYETIEANFSCIKDRMLNNLIIEVSEEQDQSSEEISQRTMETMLRFGFSFDVVKVEWEDII